MRERSATRSLFDLDDRLIELMDRAEEEASASGEVSEALQVEITEYLEAFRGKVDRIAGSGAGRNRAI